MITPKELREQIVAELLLRAWQERAVSRIGRTTKLSRAAHEHAAVALENLAADVTTTAPESTDDDPKTPAEALRLIDCAYRLAEKSTPANLRRAILAARNL